MSETTGNQPAAASEIPPASTAAPLPFGIGGSSQSPQAGAPDLNPGRGYGLEDRNQQSQQQGGGSQPAQPQAQQASNGQGQQNQQQGQQQNQPANQPGLLGNPQQGQGSQQPGQADAGNAQPDQQGQQPGQTDPDHLPIADASKLDLGLDPGQVNQSLVESYCSKAQEQGLTPAQARALAQWQLEVNTKAQEEYVTAQGKQLDSLWGKEFEANKTRVNALISRIDRMPGLASFSREFAASGAGNNATVINGLLAVAQMLAEDSMGKINGAGNVQETALDGLRDVWRKAQGLQ